MTALPSHSCAFVHSQLHKSLDILLSRYSTSPDFRRWISELVIYRVTNDPDVLIEGPIERSLFTLTHQIVKRELLKTAKPEYRTVKWGALQTASADMAKFTGDRKHKQIVRKVPG